MRGLLTRGTRIVFASGEPSFATAGSIRRESRRGGLAAPLCRRVVRGGSWNNNPANLRAANRNRNTTTNRNNNNGFRVASTPRCQSRTGYGRSGRARGCPGAVMMRRAGSGASPPVKAPVLVQNGRPAPLHSRASQSLATTRTRRFAAESGLVVSSNSLMPRPSAASRSKPTPRATRKSSTARARRCERSSL